MIKIKNKNSNEKEKIVNLKEKVLVGLEGNLIDNLGQTITLDEFTPPAVQKRVKQSEAILNKFKSDDKFLDDNLKNFVNNGEFDCNKFALQRVFDKI